MHFLTYTRTALKAVMRITPPQREPGRRELHHAVTQSLLTRAALKWGPRRKVSLFVFLSNAMYDDMSPPLFSLRSAAGQ